VQSCICVQASLHEGVLFCLRGVVLACRCDFMYVCLLMCMHASFQVCLLASGIDGTRDWVPASLSGIVFAYMRKGMLA
jgi:hypothetical protein